MKTTTIANTFEIRINEDRATFEVYLLHPRNVQFIPADAARILEREVEKLDSEGYIQN